ncbi:MAG TPA: hypothetical protein VIL43_12710 [Burkholderiales bacterium]
MEAGAIYRPLKVLSYVVILLVAAAILYAVYISIRYWSGIGV